MLWTLAGLALASPPSLNPQDLSWAVGLWASTSPVAFSQPEGRGGLLVVKDRVRHTGSRKTTVYGLSQTLLGKPSPDEPWWIQEEIWFEPGGAFLQVWLGTDGEPRRLLPSEVTPGRVVFAGAPGTFPDRVEISRAGTGIIVAHQGTLNGVPKRLEWHYQPTEPLIELQRKARAEPNQE